MKETKQRNSIIDLYKILLAVFVIFIHFPNSKFSADWVAIFRLAIPGFAAITGFYIFKKDLSYEEKLKRAKIFMVKSLKYFGFAVVFAFISQLIYTWIAGVPTVEGLKSFSFEIAPFLWKTRPALQVGTTFFQLWYFQGLVFVAAVYLLLVWLKVDVAMFALPLLSIPIYWVQKKWPLTQNFNYQVLYRNSWFMILPSFAGGWIAAHFKEVKYKLYVYAILIAALGGLIYLQIYLNRLCPIEMTFIAVIIGSIIILLLDRIPKFSCKPFYWIFGTHFYAIVFIIHVFVGCVLITKFNFNPYVNSGLFILYIFLTTLVLTQLYYLLKLGVKITKQKFNKEEVN